jgi:hypothetical protein
MVEASEDADAPDGLDEAWRRCQFDFEALRTALDAGESRRAMSTSSDVGVALKRLRREIERAPPPERVADRTPPQDTNRTPPPEPDADGPPPPEQDAG